MDRDLGRTSACRWRLLAQVLSCMGTPHTHTLAQEEKKTRAYVGDARLFVSTTGDAR